MFYICLYDKTLEAYLDVIRSTLPVDNDDIEFFLKDNKFSCKRNRSCFRQIPATQGNEGECLRELTVILTDEYLKKSKKKKLLN